MSNNSENSESPNQTADMGTRRETVRNAIQGMDTVSEDQNGFKTSLLTILYSTYMSTVASKEALIELFPPEIVTYHSNLKLPVLYQHLREVMRICGLTVEQRQGLFVPQAIVNALYGDDANLRNTASQYIADYRLSGGRTGMATAGSASRNQSQSSRPTEMSEGESTWRKVDAANRRFSNSEKYSGILTESPNLAEARRSYITYCSQKGFSRSDRVKLVSSVLKGPALSYWMSSIDGVEHFTELGSVFKALESQFDTPAHQRQIESIALSLSMEEIRKKHECNRISALGVLYHEVSRLNEQFPKIKRGDSFRTQTLMKIVEKYEWSRTTEEEVMQDALKYDAVYTKLSASLVIWELEVSRSGKDPETTDDRRVSVQNKSFIEYGAQYAYPTSSVRSRNGTSRMGQKTPPRQRGTNSAPIRRPTDALILSTPRNMRFRSQNEFKSPCFKCGRIGHWRAQCTFNDGQSMVEAARSRIKSSSDNPDTTAAKILYELVTEEDEHASQLEDDPANEEYDTAIVEIP